VSEINFFRAPDPGTPIYHVFEWDGAPVGEHVLTARTTDSSGHEVVSAQVVIQVIGDTSDLPTVSIQFLPDLTMRPWPNADYAPGWFQIGRTGPPIDDLTVFLQVGGTATPGLDYKELPPNVVIPAGQTTTLLQVSAIDDTIPEGDETVEVTLINIPPNVD